MKRVVPLALVALLACSDKKRAPEPAPPAAPAALPLPAGATARLGGVAFHGTRELAALAVSPDGELVAAATGEDVRVWSARTGATVRSVPARGFVNGFAFARDRLLYLADDRLVSLAPATGDTRAYQPCRAPIAFAVSADARAAAVACGNGDIVRLALGDGSTDALTTVVRPHSLAWSADGKWLAIMTDQMVLFDVAARTAVPLPPDRIFAEIAFAPTGAVLAYTGQDAGDVPAVTVFDLDTRTSVRHVALPEVPDRIAWSADGARIALADASGIDVLDIATGRMHRTFAHATRVVGLAFAPDTFDRLWIAHDRAVEQWDFAADRAVAGPPGPTGAITRLAFSPDGKTLASGGTDTALRLWTIATGASRKVPLPDLEPRHDVRDPAKRAVLGLGFTADGATLLEADALTASAPLRTFVAATGAPSGTEEGVRRVNLYAVAFAGAHAIQLFADEGTFRNAITAVTWPDGKRTGPKIAADYDTSYLAASADGALAAAALDRKTVSVVDTATGAVRATFPGTFDSVLSLDGQHLAIADDALHVYDVATAAVIATVPLPARAASVAMTGDRVVVGTIAGDVVLVALGAQPVLHRAAHDGEVRAIAFAPDGRSIATAGDDGQILLWPVN